MSKNAIIFGVTGQDGSYLSELLLDKGYDVVGVKRRSSTDTTGRLSDIVGNVRFHLIEGDVTDYASMSGVFSQADDIFGEHPQEVYNLAAQSHVGTSFKQPLATWDSTAKGVLNILEVIKNDYPKSRFYQASTSEMFGDNYHETHVACDGPGCGTTVRMTQDESLPFSPRSPYAVAKVAAHQSVKLYRDAYGIFGACGILFNHESPRRGEHFVTRKVTKYVAKLHWVMQRGEKPAKLGLGNLDIKRDWGHAADYVNAMWLMLQQDEPDDFVIATGETYSIGQMCECAFDCIGLDYEDWVYTDPQFLRPAEVPHLHGIPAKAERVLNWKRQITFRELIEDMVNHDIELLRSEYV